MTNYDWKNIYEIIARKLLSEYRNKQDDLIKLMEEFENSNEGTGVNLVSDLAKSSKEIIDKNQKIDPFTFFAYLNKTSNTRWKFLNWLKDQWKLEYNVSKQYDGLPYSNPRIWWYFDNTQRENIPKLWKLFEEILHGAPLDENNMGFVIYAKGVGLPTITKGLYWVKPDSFLYLNDGIKEYLKKDKAIVSKVKSFMRKYGKVRKKSMGNISIQHTYLKEYKKTVEEYQEIIELIKSNTGESFLDITNEINNYKAHEPSKGHVDRKNLGDNRPVKKDKEIDKVKNIIYFGPPGTGKTYKMLKDAEKYAVIKELTDLEFYSNLIDNNNLTWFQCIIFAMLDKGNEGMTVPSISEHPIIIAKAEGTKADDRIWSQLQVHAQWGCLGVKESRRMKPLVFWKDKGSKWSIGEHLIDEKMADITEEILKKIESHKKNNKKKIKKYEFITFHQSFSYEDFIEGIKPSLNEESDNLVYKIEKGVFLRLAERARNDSNSHYALFIDEINRGNISNIFGELITLIEEDKREGCDNEVKVTLPYSKEEFTVPKNLHIVATMNTADRSIESLDSALRRRFSFIEMAPDSNILNEKVIEGVNLGTLLKTINKRLLILVGKDKLIGHSYFMKMESIEDLRDAFKNKIIPLLEEYFYNDRQKILMVLGSKFVTKKEWKTEGIKFFDSTDDLEDVITYEFTKSTDGKKEDAFRSIYKETDETGTNDNTNNKQSNNVDGKK